MISLTNHHYFDIYEYIYNLHINMIILTIGNRYRSS